jgi:hypothetical protein
MQARGGCCALMEFCFIFVTGIDRELTQGGWLRALQAGLCLCERSLYAPAYCTACVCLDYNGHS